MLCKRILHDQQDNKRWNMKKKLFIATSSLAFVAPVALVACGGTETTDQTQYVQTFSSKDDFNKSYRSKTFANLSADSRYKAFDVKDADGTVKTKDSVNYYDVLTRIYNDSVDGMIDGLTIAENFYNDGVFNGGAIKPWYDAKTFTNIVDKNADAENGQKQNIEFDDNYDWSKGGDGFKEAHAFKSWTVKKDEFENNISTVHYIHDEIKTIVKNNNKNDYILYVPKESVGIGKDESFKIYLFQKIKTSDKIIKARDYFNNNFKVSMESLSELHSTYTLQPTQRFSALPKEVLTWNGAISSSTYTANDFAAPLFGDYQAIKDEQSADRSHGSNMQANLGVTFIGSDSDWENIAMKELKDFSFNVSWVRNENTYDEQLKVTIMENDPLVKWQSPTSSNEATETPAVINMATFILDGKDVLRFAELANKPLNIWKAVSGPGFGETAKPFTFSPDKLFELVNSKTYSFDGLSSILAGLQSYAPMFAYSNLFEARTQISDLFAVLSVVNPNKSNIYNLKDRTTFDKFVSWVKTNYPFFSLPTMQLILEQLDNVDFPATPTPITHMELQFTSQLYKMMIDFFNDPANASLVPTAQSTQP